MTLQKNRECRVKIVDISYDGLGIGKIDGIVVFVPNTVIGDELIVKILKVRKNCVYAKISSIISPSPNRIKPECDVAHRCGGCLLQAMSYAAECDFKYKRVKDCMERIGKISCPVSQIAAAEHIYRYRNKAQYPIGWQNEENVAGFYAQRSHRVVPSEDCKLQPPIFSEILKVFLQFLNEHSLYSYQSHKERGVIRHLYLRRSSIDGNIILSIVSSEPSLPNEKELVAFLTSRFPSIIGILINYNPDDTNVILGKNDRLLYGVSELEDTLAGVRLAISPQSFYQINHSQTEKLYKIAKEFALSSSSRKTLLDLYCGVGSIGLSMADSFEKVIGIEVTPEAVENARRNAELNGIENAEFYCADASKAAEIIKNKQLYPDIIILDPPRKGCAIEVIDFLSNISPEIIVMISCNPATCARDLALLESCGYVAKEIKPVDLFPRTTHIEIAVKLIKKNYNQSAKL